MAGLATLAPGHSKLVLRFQDSQAAIDNTAESGTMAVLAALQRGRLV